MPKIIRTLSMQQDCKIINVKSTLLFLFYLTLLAGCGGGGDATTPISTTINSITISPINEKIKTGNSLQLIVTAIYTDETSADVSSSVKWSSSLVNIASISSNGILDASAAGKTLITAVLDGKQDNVEVDIIALVDLSISPVALTLAKGSVQQYTATGLYSDHSTEDLSHAVSWSADNAEISNNGLLTATNIGTNTIDADIDNNSSSTSLTVSSAELTRITINTPSLIAKGISEQLSAVGFFSDGTSQDIGNLVTWSSSNSSIASIDENNGLLAAAQPGNVTITASTNSLTTTTTIEISNATLTEIVVTPSSISLAKGSSTTINVIAIFSDQSFADISKQVDWLNTDTTKVEILTGDSSLANNLLAKDIGLATLTAQFSGFEATSQITVTDAVLTQLTISPTNISIPIGLSQRYFASGLYSDNTVQDLSTQVTWISDRESSATIDNVTSLQGTAHSLAAGDVTISATLGSVTQSTTLNITTAQLNSIEIQPSKQAAAIDFSIPIKAIGHYSDGSKFDITDKAEWSSNNQGILNLADSKKGTIQTLSEGDTLINASHSGISGLGQVFVSSTTLQSIFISANLTTIPKELQQQLQAIGTFSDDTTADITLQVTWQSDDASLASVDNTLFPGLLQTNSPGDTIITASLNNITSEVPISITDETISQITVSVEQSNLNIKTSTQATASALFSDDNTIDMTRWVNWTSSAPNIASASNSILTKGFISTHAEGHMTISASLNNISSQAFPITVTQNPDSPASINLTITPNVILKDGLDGTELKAIVLSADQNGEIPDGTAVKFSITEGDNTRTIETTTLNGAASASINSTYDGLIRITSEIPAQNIDNTAALFSTDGFDKVIGMSGQSSAAFENGKLLKGSLFAIFARNISNREFKVNQANITITKSNNSIELIESVVDPSFLSDGTLSPGEFTLIVYELDDDIESENISISYNFKDEISNTIFLKGITFQR